LLVLSHLVFFLLYLAGVLVCLLYRRVSGRLALVLVGFAVESLYYGWNLASGLLGVLPRQGFFVPAFVVVSRLLGLGLIIAGLAGVLADVRRQLTRLRGGLPPATGPDAAHLPSLEDLRQWEPPGPGGEDIRP
jgi:hypothetical protein